MYRKFLLDTFAKYSFGGLAQLARALRWQRRGHGFESHTLHKKTNNAIGFQWRYFMSIFRINIKFFK